MVKTHSEMIEMTVDAQAYVQDGRDKAREREAFVSVRGGQWESSVWARLVNRPRYQIDLITPIIRQICGDISRSDFEIGVLPTSSDASKKTAATYEGVLRHIANISRSKYVYNSAARDMVTSGIGGWRISNRYLSGNHFDQDLLIDYIHDFKDTVFFDTGARLQTHEDAEWVIVLKALTKAQFEKQFPKAKGQQGISEQWLTNDAWFKDGMVVGEYLCKKTKKRDLILLSNGMIFEDTDDYRSIIDEYMAAGIKETDRRTKDITTVYRRYYSGDDWLDDSTETLFDMLPVVPLYGNYSIIGNEINYFGEPEKLIDPQRVMNYTFSRLVEDTSLKPKSKVWMTREQASGNEADYRTLNVDNKPVAFYNHIDGQIPPDYRQPSPPDPTLIAIMGAASDYINQVAGRFAANMGDNPGLQSGVAIDHQISQGNNSSSTYFESLSLAITHTAKILINAIPKNYGDRQSVRIVGEDGTADFAKLREATIDRQTGRVIELNDLSKGVYDVVVAVGPGYQNKQQETVENIIEIAKVDPSILQIGSDVLLQNINAPGLKQISERKRRQMVMAGVIPEEQLSEEEKALLQQQQQQGQQQTSPMDQLALATAQAEIEKAQAQTADIISKVEERSKKSELENRKLALQAESMAISMQESQRKAQLEMQTTIDGHYKTIAETMKIIKDAIGADAIMHPAAIAAYEKNAVDLNK
jgi:hypothetical protein